MLTERLGQAQEALDRDRLDEARRIATSSCGSSPTSPRSTRCSGWWPTARSVEAGGDELETAQALHPNVELLPVLADVYRAQRRWADVERVWSEVREMSPAQEVLAEARIVAAGAQADRGDLAGALRDDGPRRAQEPKRVRDHHLRQWYVLGDLHDRAGNPLEATRWFELVAGHDPEFVDVVDRLRALGR